MNDPFAASLPASSDDLERWEASPPLPAEESFWCGSCTHYLDPFGRPTGKCRRHAPQPVVFAQRDGLVRLAEWPLVTDWTLSCGDYSMAGVTRTVPWSSRPADQVAHAASLLKKESAEDR